MWKSEKPIHIVLHLGIIAGIILVIAFLFFKVYLPFTTNHNEKIVVPALKGRSIADVEELLYKAGLRYEINDSTYIEGKPANQVITQYPEAISEVKSNRKIYLTITAAHPPKIKMPKLIDHSLRSADLTLKSMDLKKGTITYEDNPFKDLVIKQLYKGSEIQAGTHVDKGSTIDLIVGNGNTAGEVQLPDLTGKNYAQAAEILTYAGFQLGSVLIDSHSDASTGTIIKQHPAPDAANTNYPADTKVDIWIAE
jgi:beta-lactam-binding protein with PASTA domain